MGRANMPSPCRNAPCARFADEIRSYSSWEAGVPRCSS
ncbi:hypothetical protein PCLA_13f0099 [Pseudomonas citronellolis]|nr:hypothetical protein PCLA_13f0099 [Pseudomonas citronellolis]